MIIGITGTIGAGKGTVVEYLKTKGFRHFSARDLWVKEVERRGLPVNRDTITATANDLRVQHGPEYFAQCAIAEAQSGGNIVAESVRSVGEADYLKKHGAILWAVDADIAKRYERIQKRASVTDQVTFERFKADEAREWDNQDPTKQNLKVVIGMADAVLINNVTPEELFAQVELALGRSPTGETLKKAGV